MNYVYYITKHFWENKDYMDYIITAYNIVTKISSIQSCHLLCESIQPIPTLLGKWILRQQNPERCLNKRLVSPSNNKLQLIKVYTIEDFLKENPRWTLTSQPTPFTSMHLEALILALLNIQRALQHCLLR